MKTYVAAFAAMLAASTTAMAAEPTTLAAFAELARPAPSASLSYGPAATQAIDVFLPEGRGPHPVAILIHGGCWRNLPGAGREQLRHMGKALADRGIAVWNVGYRRADEEGGGYPGTFQDVATAFDRLREEADRYRLDLSRTVVVGHSAGGHLALWASSRSQLSMNSPLYSADPFIPGATISLAGIGDLRDFSRFVPVICGPGVIERLTPQPTDALYAEVSPAEMPAPQGPVVMISGTLDRLIPPYVAHDYVRAMQRKHGVSIERVDIPDAGHFDLVMPGTQAWNLILERISADVRR